MKTKKVHYVLGLCCLMSNLVFGSDYVIDKEGQHAYVIFKASHLGYSYIIGHFENFEGKFTYDSDNPTGSTVSVRIDAKSLDSDHAERDKHLRGPDYFNVKKYPTITFESTAFTGDKNTGKLAGNLSLHGVTKLIVLDVIQIGEGKDPWGGYRSGFQGKVTLDAKKFGFPARIGDVEVELIVEGIRQ